MSVNRARPDVVNETVSYNEYTALFDRPRARVFASGTYGRTNTDLSELFGTNQFLTRHGEPRPERAVGGRGDGDAQRGPVLRRAELPQAGRRRFPLQQRREDRELPRLLRVGRELPGLPAGERAEEPSEHRGPAAARLPLGLRLGAVPVRPLQLRSGLPPHVRRRLEPRRLRDLQQDRADGEHVLLRVRSLVVRARVLALEGHRGPRRTAARGAAGRPVRPDEPGRGGGRASAERRVS